MSELFYALAILACPVAMGVMMWFMMKGMGSSTPAPEARPEELASLRAELDQLRSAQRDSVPGPRGSL